MAKKIKQDIVWIINFKNKWLNNILLYLYMQYSSHPIEKYNNAFEVMEDFQTYIFQM